MLCLPGDQSHPFAQPSINPLACCICWARLLGRAVFPPWNEGPNFGSYTRDRKTRQSFIHEGNMPATQPGTEGIVMKKANTQDFPGGSVVKTPHSYYIGLGSIPCKGTKILYAAQCGQKNNTKSTQWLSWSLQSNGMQELTVQWDAGMSLTVQSGVQCSTWRMWEVYEIATWKDARWPRVNTHSYKFKYRIFRTHLIWRKSSCLTPIYRFLFRWEHFPFLVEPRGEPWLTLLPKYQYN